MPISRRALLFGFGAVVAASAMPRKAVAARAVGRHPALGLGYGSKIKPKYPGPYLQLHPAQWRHFERDGFNMDLCRLIKPLPKSNGDIYVRR